eukprot:5887273-Amphidinium_carterae.1
MLPLVAFTLDSTVSGKSWPRGGASYALGPPQQPTEGCSKRLLKGRGHHKLSNSRLSCEAAQKHSIHCTGFKHHHVRQLRKAVTFVTTSHRIILLVSVVLGKHCGRKEDVTNS